MKILHIPNPKLRVKTKPITEFGDKLQKIITDMIETMYDSKGVGLAATQVGLDIAISVIDVSPEHNDPMVIINPEIVERGNELTLEEGCLSVPDCYDRVVRADRVKVKALDRHGKSFEIEGEGLLAQCLQHEIDHLNGKLYLDQLSSLKRRRMHHKVKKFVRNQNKNG